MISFIVYDLIFLVLFTLAVVIFLYKRRNNLQRQGWLYLYRTKVGIKFIDWTSKRFSKVLYVLQYMIVFCGYGLMIAMVYFLIKFSYVYLTSPFAAEALKVPVIMPLIPYLPEIFKLDFLPHLYFSYFIIIIAVMAIPHEFAHGIIARLNKIKIHATGFGFLGPFLAAFVEPDEKEMEKKGKFPQLAILGAGTFANVIFTIIFSLIFWGFFASAFSSAGVMFNSYASDVINVSDINSINGINITSINEIPDLVDKTSNYTEIGISGNNLSFFVNSNNLLTALENKIGRIMGIVDSPAFNARISGAITEIDGTKVRSFDELGVVLGKYQPGNKIKISTVDNNGNIKEYEVELGNINGKAFLGIGILESDRSGILGWVYTLISKIKNPFVYYTSSLGNFGWFIYYLIWWCVLISLSVALVNMLPVGIFDGGRFFYLSVWGLTGSEKVGKWAFKISTWAILLLVIILMIRWVPVLF